MPVAARALGLPDWATLGLAHLGCAALIGYLALLGRRLSPNAHPAAIFGFCLTAGASAPFITSMGWLGYYDSLLAIALLTVAFTRIQLLIIAACLCAPWIDERFVLGLPLALLVRFSLNPQSPLSEWLKREALVPLALTLAYTALRLRLGGSGGSQTILQYLQQFVFEQPLSGLQRLFGAWSGLRLGWILAVIGLAAAFTSSSRLRSTLAPVLLITAVLTALISLHTALDLSRSTVLLLPLVPLGWIAASRMLHPRGLTIGALSLGLLSASLPAHHVFWKASLRADSFFHPSSQLMTAQNNLGLAYSEGRIGPQDYTEGRRWFQRAAENDYAVALKNLALLYDHGLGGAVDAATAVRYYRRAAELGQVEAQNDLGAILYLGQKAPRNLEEAAKWIRLAAEKDSVVAQKNLGVLLLRGEGVKQDSAEAAYWFRRAAEAGNAVAQRHLGLMHLDGNGVPADSDAALKWLTLAANQEDAEAANQLGLVFLPGTTLPRDTVRAHVWLSTAIRLGHPDAQKHLADLESSMSEADLAKVRATKGN